MRLYILDMLDSWPGIQCSIAVGVGRSKVGAVVLYHKCHIAVLSRSMVVSPSRDRAGSKSHNEISF